MNTQPLKNNISSYIIQTHEEEIKRIAMELHEGVGQSLSSLFSGMQLIETAIEQPAMKIYAGDMKQLLEKAIQEIRLLAVELHPPTLTTFGLISAIKSYIKIYTSTYGIEVEMENLGIESQISDRDSITLFRVCQEALVNIARYADTTKASIIFKWEKNMLLIMIKDSGKGFEVEAAMNKLSGLAAMCERMHLIGGNCTIFSKIDDGTSIEISLPLY
ncbi:sensor histidine kinase [Peribacillus simplex]|uniref:histidine kinase n=1 Tax=Peribacillus castrilensis TaxID=2897690 RepID=A0AAW9NJJ1_9BACI|nr:histidine kinase [Peribacillus simplex]MEC0275877.1 histidine kinase [Peribacillus castrilensis]MEC0300276.1 histidine kinase [Peribacillus castrilensis]TKH04543.1 sensor histidine kinase [Peribacillus simplex]